jgi:glycosyltransferase involved in cell wall biosynthesis
LAAAGKFSGLLQTFQRNIELRRKRIIFAVYDDLHLEYRGFKAAETFIKAGWDVKVAGVKFDDTELKGWDGIPNIRIPLNNNFPLAVKMLIFWIRMTIILIREKADVIYSHDLFPLMPAFLASKIKRKPYIYDAHEFWHGNSHIENRPVIKKFWTLYERIFIKGAKKVITVSEPIARELETIYGLDEVGVFTNLPLRKELPADRRKIHRMLGLEEEKKIVLYQGRFLLNNGLETLIKAFRNVNEEAVFVLAGEGYEKKKLEKLIKELKLSERIFFIGPFAHGELISYTVCAFIGLCLIKNSGKSFYYSTPNKMFEFIQAEVPQIASDFPEMTRFVKGYGAGVVIDPDNGTLIAETINSLLENKEEYNRLKINCTIAAKELVWESYSESFVKIIQ